MCAPSLLLAGLLLAAGTAAEGPSEAWHLFTGTTGNFQILLPGPPTISHGRHATYLGDVRGTRLEARKGALRATLTHQDIPRIATKLMPDSIILERAGDSIVEANQGIAGQERSYTWRGHSARELTYEVSGETPRLTRVRLILVEARIYMTIASWPSPRPIPAELVRFLDSFALTAPADATPAVSAGETGP